MQEQIDDISRKMKTVTMNQKKILEKNMEMTFDDLISSWT